MLNAARQGDEPDRARQIFAELRSLDLTDSERSAIADEFSAAAELEGAL